MGSHPFYSQPPLPLSNEFDLDANIQTRNELCLFIEMDESRIGTGNICDEPEASCSSRK